MKTLDTTCGIYDTRYTLTSHRDGSITIKSPYIKWVRNTGSLEFRNAHFQAGELANRIKEAFANQSLCIRGYKGVSIKCAVDYYTDRENEP